MVDEIQVRLTLLEAENTDMKAAVKYLKAENKDLKAETKDLKIENTDMKTENTDMKAAVKDLKAENTDIKAAVKDLKAENTDLKAAVKDIKTLVTNNTSTLGPLTHRVAFHARPSKSVHVGTPDRIPLENVMLNEGGAFNGSTGVFTVPVTVDKVSDFRS
nr:hypothetical protein BaRGS_009746 [Batillaria attramentaria]